MTARLIGTIDGMPYHGGGTLIHHGQARVFVDDGDATMLVRDAWLGPLGWRQSLFATVAAGFDGLTDLLALDADGKVVVAEDSFSDPTAPLVAEEEYGGGAPDADSTRLSGPSASTP